jgi:hypothetical protein
MEAPAVSHEVDARSVVNPVQARTLLNAVREVRRSGPMLYAWSGTGGSRSAPP